MSILGSIPIIGNLLGGDSSSSSGILGSVMSFTGITGMFESLIGGIIVLVIIFKIIDRI